MREGDRERKQKNRERERERARARARERERGTDQLATVHSGTLLREQKHFPWVLLCESESCIGPSDQHNTPQNSLETAGGIASCRLGNRPVDRLCQPVVHISYRLSDYVVSLTPSITSEINLNISNIYTYIYINLSL